MNEFRHVSNDSAELLGSFDLFRQLVMRGAGEFGTAAGRTSAGVRALV